MKQQQSSKTGFVLLILAMVIGAVAMTAFYEWYPADREASRLAAIHEDSILMMADTLSVR